MSDHPNIDRFREGVEAVRDRFADPLRVTVDFPTAAGALVEIEALVERAEAAEAKLSTLLCDLTGGLLSKPTYDVRTMLTYIEDHTQRLIDEEVREAVAEVEAVIERVRAMHYPADNDGPRTPRCEHCEGKAGAHPCGCWAERDRQPVCGECNAPKRGARVDWPCPTLRALDGEAGE